MEKKSVRLSGIETSTFSKDKLWETFQMAIRPVQIIQIILVISYFQMFNYCPSRKDLGGSYVFHSN